MFRCPVFTPSSGVNRYSIYVDCHAVQYTSFIVPCRRIGLQKLESSAMIDVDYFCLFVLMFNKNKDRNYHIFVSGVAQF